MAEQGRGGVSRQSGRQRKAVEVFGDMCEVTDADLRAYNNRTYGHEPKVPAAGGPPANPLNFAATAFGVGSRGRGILSAVQTVVGGGAAPSSSSSATTAAGATAAAPGTVSGAAGASQGEQAGPEVPCISPEEQRQNDIEEEIIARTQKLAEKLTAPKTRLPSGASRVADLATAVRKGVRECNTLVQDWTSSGAKLIGCIVKVYWDGDDVWYYGRVLNFDAFHNRHFIFYFEDSTSEWIDLDKEAVIIGLEIVLAVKQAKWPAQRFYVSEPAWDALKKLKLYSKDAVYIEYFGDEGLAEHAFLPEESLVPFSHQHLLPPRRTKKLEAAMASAVAEQLEIDSVVDTVLSLARRAAPSVLQGGDWVGLRVRANASPYYPCLLYTSPSPRDRQKSRMPSSA